MPTATQSGRFASTPPWCPDRRLNAHKEAILGVLRLMDAFYIVIPGMPYTDMVRRLITVSVESMLTDKLDVVAKELTEKMASALPK